MATIENFFTEFADDYNKLNSTFDNMTSKVNEIESELETTSSRYRSLTASMNDYTSWDDPVHTAVELRMDKTTKAMKLVSDSITNSVIPLLNKVRDEYYATIELIKSKQKILEAKRAVVKHYEREYDTATRRAMDASDKMIGYNEALDSQNEIHRWLNRAIDDRDKTYALLETLRDKAQKAKREIVNTDTVFSLSNLSASLDITAYDSEKASGTEAVVGGENYYTVDTSKEGINKAEQYIDAQIAILQSELNELRLKPNLTEQETARLLELDGKIRQLQGLKQELSTALVGMDPEEDALLGNITIANIIGEIYGIETGSIDPGVSDIINNYANNNESDNLSDLSDYMKVDPSPIPPERVTEITDRLSKYNDQAMADYKNGLISYEEYQRRMDVSMNLAWNLKNTNSNDATNNQFWVNSNSSKFVNEMNSIRNIDSNELNSAIKSNRSITDIVNDLNNKVNSISSGNSTDKEAFLTNVELTSRIETGIRTGEITIEDGRKLLGVVTSANTIIWNNRSTNGIGDAIWDLDRNIAKVTLPDLINDREKNLMLSNQ